MTEMGMKTLTTWERKRSRIRRPSVQHGIWKLRTNQELRQLYKDLDIVADIKQQKMEWIGLVVRRGQSRKYWNKPGWLEIEWYISAFGLC